MADCLGTVANRWPDFLCSLGELAALRLLEHSDECVVLPAVLVEDHVQRLADLHVARYDYVGNLGLLSAVDVHRTGARHEGTRCWVVEVHLKAVFLRVDRDEIGVAVAVDVADCHELQACVVCVDDAQIDVVKAYSGQRGSDIRLSIDLCLPSGGLFQKS